MAFEIRKVGSTVKKTFNIRDILRLLGDRVNDEVRIDDESFRISTAIYFPVTVPYGDPEGYFLVVNGAMYDHGINSAFHITEATLVWHGGFTLEIGDRVYLKYLTLRKNND
jgi:hypothetical protein